ncbi:CD34 protein, partial [Polyodon spathula]|nr:hematopoietic progenitor cell antigen CD34-like isoform X1 [Polyodon spathula]XP_041083575.1 hematopoietic progenitor cell antigen CD34-like isoform X2 [Polyodon spathula]MBN3278610.1 CD34 protein [Polyodon spathula]
MAAAALNRMNEAKEKLILVLVLCALLMIDHTNCQEPGTSPATPPAPAHSTTLTHPAASRDPAAPTDPTSPSRTTGTADPKGGVDAAGLSDPTSAAIPTDQARSLVTSTGPVVAVSKAEATTIPVNSTVTIVDTNPASDSGASSTAHASANTIASTPGSSTTSPQTESSTRSQATTHARDTTSSPSTPNESTELQGNFIPEVLVHCVHKEDIQDKDAIQLEMKEETTCEQLKQLILEVKHELCNEDSQCNIAIYQKPRSKNILISSSKITENPKDVASYLNSENAKKQLGLMTVTPHWRKHPPSILVSLVIAGLLLAALLIGGYCYKTRKTGSSKGERLTEDPYQAESDNQGGTLVSVAPLHPPESQGKPSTNRDSQDTGKNHPPSPNSTTTTTNGHSAKQAPVADTEL